MSYLLMERRLGNLFQQCSRNVLFPGLPVNTVVSELVVGV